MKQRHLIHADGFLQLISKGLSLNEIKQLIGADALDLVKLHEQGAPLRVMFVDDDGHAKGLPVNHRATAMYHANCRPGSDHVIRGAVVIVFENEFGGPL